MKFVLRLKHWQLFLLVCGIPFALYIGVFATMFGTMFRTMASGPQNDIPTFPGFIGVFGFLFAIAWLVAVIIMASWTFQVATGLYKKRPADSKLKIKRFYFAFFYPIVYVALVGVLAISLLGYINSIENTAEPDPSAFMWLFLIIPFHFFCIVCFFYIIYFVGKALKSVELGREAIAGKYISESVLVWMFFIGVWFIQPKVNKIFGEAPTDPGTDSNSTLDATLISPS